MNVVEILTLPIPLNLLCAVEPNGASTSQHSSKTKVGEPSSPTIRGIEDARDKIKGMDFLAECTIKIKLIFFGLV